MKIKHLLFTLAAVLMSSAALYAQTPEEVVAKMQEQLLCADAEGYAMDMTMKMAIVGSATTHILVRGEKTKIQIAGNSGSEIDWTDATTKWAYDPAKADVTVSAKPVEGKKDGDLAPFMNLTEGYKVISKGETADEWIFVCKKLSTNKDKDAAKKIDLKVSKKTCLPTFLQMKKSIVTMTIENVALGVTEDEVTFRPEDYPGVKIVDNR